MKKNIIALISASAMMLASCGGAKSSGTSADADSAEAEISSMAQSLDSMLDSSGGLAKKIFDRMVEDAPTNILQDPQSYEFTSSTAHFGAEDLQSMGNYWAWGCYPMKDGQYLVAKYSLVQHFNFKPTYQPPDVSFYSYNANTDELKPIHDSRCLEIDSTDFLAQNPLVCGYKNHLYFEFDEEGIIVNYISSNGFPPIRYNWNGDKFIKLPCDVDYMPNVFTSHSPDEFEAEEFRSAYFALSRNNDGTISVMEPNGSKAAILSINKENKIDAVRILSKLYKINGIGVGDRLDDEYIPEWLEDHVEINDQAKTVTATYATDNTVVKFLADYSTRQITETNIELLNNRTAEAQFAIPDSAKTDRTGREIWNKLLDLNLFGTRSRVEFINAGANSATFHTYEESIVWDYVEYSYCYCPQMAYYKMQDGTFKVYALETLIYDEYDQINLRYTQKKRELAKAYIYDGSKLTECKFDLPDPTPGNLPTDTSKEYDPIGSYDFGVSSVYITYDEAYEEGTDAEGGDASSTSQDYIWTGQGWKTAPQE